MSKERTNIASLSPSQLKHYEKRLQARYTECTLHGHLIPNHETCEYCFRHLSPSQDNNFQEALDHFQGLQKLVELERKYGKTGH